ncbi:MAG: HAMP domain-containing protein, partial [Melioribacteraceae bacterium]|nr:HAMP domain-containing protein [Melioribacteraceae bacterium]
IILSVGIPNYFLINQFQTNFRERSELYLNSSVDMILFNLKNLMRDNHSKNIQETIDNIVLNKNVHHIRIFNSDGLVHFSTTHGDINKNIQNVAPGHIDLNFAQIEKRKISLMDDHHAFTAFQAIKNDHECQSCHGSEPIIAFIDIDTHLTSSEKNFDTGTRHFIYLGIVLIVLMAFGLLVLFNYFINKPLMQISGAIDKLKEGDYDLKLPIKRIDEFGTLNNHFNKMVRELKLSSEKIEEFHLEQLRRADKMVTLGEIAAAMAHDINNHSAIIMTRADYLQMQMESVGSMKEYREELNVIINQVQKISKTTGSILKNAKRIPSEFIDIDLNRLVGLTLNNLEPLLNKKEVTIERNLTEGINTVHGNVEQIEQVIMNLINNALDASNTKGKIIVSVLKNKTGEIELTVQDSGNGISSYDIEKIYSPFFTTKANEKGTGLGLYIVKNICNNHNAKIECSSYSGKGTTFTMTFKSEKRS